MMTNVAKLLFGVLYPHKCSSFAFFLRIFMFCNRADTVNIQIVTTLHQDQIFVFRFHQAHRLMDKLVIITFFVWGLCKDIRVNMTIDYTILVCKSLSKGKYKI